MTVIHRYRAELSWTGSTGVGYDGYERTHRVVVPPADLELRLTSDPAFLGDPQFANPEQLLLAAASSCQLLAFLAIAARSRIDVRAYEDEADAIMPEDQRPTRITKITMRPRITVGPGADIDRVRRLVAKAHDECFIANTLNAEVVIEPTITVAEH